MVRVRARSLLVAAWLLTTTTARAQSPLTLDWNAPAECPDAAWVEAAVLRLLPTPPTEPLRVHASVRPDPAGGWQVDLRLEGAARGTRRLRAASCESVARASALIVALALDPQAAALASDEMARAEAAPTPAIPSPAALAPASGPMPDATPRPATPAPRSPTAPRRRLRGHGLAAVALETGYVPGLTPAALVGGGLGTRLWRADILLQIAPFSSGAVRNSPGYGADFSLLSAEVRGCLGPSWQWVAVEGCVGLRATRVNGRGTGLDESYRDHASLLSAGAGVLLRIPSHTRVAAEAGFDASLPMTRPSFVLLEGDRELTIHRIAPVTARATLGVSVRF